MTHFDYRERRFFTSLPVGVWNKGGLVATKWTWNSIIKAVLEVMCIALIVEINAQELLLILAIVLSFKVL